MSFFLGIDLGTSYFKAGIFDENGKLHGLGRHPVEKSGYGGSVCELEVAVFWKTLRLCIRYAMKEANISSNKIQALSYSSQANSFLLLDESDNPLTPLILWSDERAEDGSAQVQTLLKKTDFLYKTGLGISPGKHSLIAKIGWFQKQQPYIWEKVRSIMSISDYLTFTLTGNRISDVSTSSMTGLLNVPEGRWWQEATDIFNIEKTHLPTLLKMGSLVGNLTEKGAGLIGLSPDTNMFSGGLDHHMVAIGAGLPRLNYISESTGTVLACVNCQKEYKPRIGVNISQGVDDSHYFQMAFNANGAIVLEWYQSNYAPALSIPQLLALAETIAPGCEGLVAKSSANEYMDLKGFINVKKRYTHGHFVRAILESTGLSLDGLVKKLDGTDAQAIVPSGGGARSRLWLQIKADILDRPFLLPESGELACKGAAMLCRVGMSRFKNMDEVMESQMAFTETIYPDPVEMEKYKNWSKDIKNKELWED
ncbi:FGGY-family carbohydrate kinase [uncultured Proteiniphilum sp.]|uniref:FGGY-family carbohydrate kinase n=1 Tax=uncultured Proteiniphilum sp. TaxID=497637 RepID=UPI00260F6067|nr:FGGY-family carbohydrate kinase [uncultured Proteiniphilum sp.]